MGMEPPEIMTTIRAREPEGSPEWIEADEWLKEWEAPDEPESDPPVAVRLGMDLWQAERIAELMPRLPAEVKLRVHDQLWLKAVIEGYLPRVLAAERDRFSERANSVLKALDPQEEGA